MHNSVWISRSSIPMFLQLLLMYLFRASVVNKKVSEVSFHLYLNREVQQFRPSVRNSPEVRFAVQAFAALNSNNFVKFFKLVQTASYLNACLLHCYFNQVRNNSHFNLYNITQCKGFLILYYITLHNSQFLYSYNRLFKFPLHLDGSMCLLPNR